MTASRSDIVPHSPSSNDGFQNELRQAFVTGTALTIPLLLTVIVLGFVLNFVSQTLNPVVDIAEYLQLGELPDVVIEVSTILTLVVLILLVGLVAERTSPKRITGGVDAVMESIPGVSSVYNGFRQMSEVLVDGDVGSFQEVKLVEFPTRGTYSIGYLTGRPGPEVLDATGHRRMKTVFMPLAPNPVMGGFVVYLPEDRILDIDMTIEESVQTIVTSGVATSVPDRDATRDT